MGIFIWILQNKEKNGNFILFSMLQIVRENVVIKEIINIGLV